MQTQLTSHYITLHYITLHYIFSSYFIKEIENEISWRQTDKQT